MLCLQHSKQSGQTWAQSELAVVGVGLGRAEQKDDAGDLLHGWGIWQ